jgi:hypothetical protein
MEYRMYGLVSRSLSDMQKAIQFGHAVVEYELLSRGNSYIRQMYDEWSYYWKTFIVLNGGSTNSRSLSIRGSLQEWCELLETNGVPTAVFYEPDVNDAMTAIVFLVDERVWNKEVYPDFPLPESMIDEIVESGEQNAEYQKWLESIGGPTNAFLRSFLPRFKLA